MTCCNFTMENMKKVLTRILPLDIMAAVSQAQLVGDDLECQNELVDHHIATGTLSRALVSVALSFGRTTLGVVGLKPAKSLCLLFRWSWGFSSKCDACCYTEFSVIPFWKGYKFLVQFFFSARVLSISLVVPFCGATCNILPRNCSDEIQVVLKQTSFPCIPIQLKKALKFYYGCSFPQV